MWLYVIQPRGVVVWLYLLISVLICFSLFPSFLSSLHFCSLLRPFTFVFLLTFSLLFFVFLCALFCRSPNSSTFSFLSSLIEPIPPADVRPSAPIHSGQPAAGGPAGERRGQGQRKPGGRQLGRSSCGLPRVGGRGWGVAVSPADAQRF